MCWADLCEDEELKERIAEIQREIEHSRLTKSRELSRRRSTNVIRRCVRRKAACVTPLPPGKNVNASLNVFF